MEKRKISIFDILKGAATVFSAIISFVFVLLLVALFAGAFVGAPEIPPGNIALIPIEGLIVPAAPAYAATSPDRILSFLKKAEEMDRIAGIIVEINSPGSSPVAAEEIANEIKRVSKAKPVVAVIREIGTSGAYWIASAADRIYASALSITGSIGASASGLEWAGLLERYNVSYRRLVSGKYKDTGTPFRRLTEEERQLFQELLDKLHRAFISAVAENRNLPIDQVEQFANGWVYLGQDALELGLVDELGGIEEAKAWLGQKLNITPELARFRARPTLLEALAGMAGAAGYGFGLALQRPTTPVLE